MWSQDCGHAGSRWSTFTGKPCKQSSFKSYTSPPNARLRIWNQPKAFDQCEPTWIRWQLIGAVNAPSLLVPKNEICQSTDVSPGLHFQAHRNHVAPHLGHLLARQPRLKFHLEECKHLGAQVPVGIHAGIRQPQSWSSLRQYQPAHNHMDGLTTSSTSRAYASSIIRQVCPLHIKQVPFSGRARSHHCSPLPPEEPARPRV